MLALAGACSERRSISILILTWAACIHPSRPWSVTDVQVTDTLSPPWDAPSGLTKLCSGPWLLGNWWWLTEQARNGSSRLQTLIRSSYSPKDCWSLLPKTSPVKKWHWTNGTTTSTELLLWARSLMHAVTLNPPVLCSRCQPCGILGTESKASWLSLARARTTCGSELGWDGLLYPLGVLSMSVEPNSTFSAMQSLREILSHLNPPTRD